MKILYISHHREPSGWGQVARDYILAMDSVGLDVVPIPIVFQGGAEMPERITELEQGDTRGCDICIQHVLPHLMEYHGCFEKNIGMYEAETISIKHTSWPGKLALMDEVWIPCQDMSYDIGNLNYKIIPHACDITKYSKQYEPLEGIPQDGTFYFYFIGEFSTRKHLVSLIRAFHSTFSPNEPVGLVIKVNKPGMPDEQLAAEVNQASTLIKKNLRLFPDEDDYIREFVIPSKLTEEEMMQLHTACDCFVMPSHGEAWCIPVFDAMAMGKFPICGNVGGPADFIGDNCGMRVRGDYNPIIAMTDGALEEFGTARELWFDISVQGLGNTMRIAYEHQDKQSWLERGRDRACEYSYENIGNLIKDQLCTALSVK